MKDKGQVSSRATTRFVTRITSSVKVAPDLSVATKIISTLITGYITVPRTTITTIIEKTVSVVTRINKKYYLEGKLYTTISVPTKLVIGSRVVTKIITSTEETESSGYTVSRPRTQSTQVTSSRSRKVTVNLR